MRQEGKGAYDTCLEVLQQLGEVVPASVERKQFIESVEKIQAQFDGMTDTELLNMKKMNSPFHNSLMQFYNQVCFISYFVNPQMLKWFACRIVELSLQHGVSKYSALGMMRYSMVLGGKLLNNVAGAHRLGKMSLKLLERFDGTDLLPSMVRFDKLVPSAKLNGCIGCHF